MPASAQPLPRYKALASMHGVCNRLLEHKDSKSCPIFLACG